MSKQPIDLRAVNSLLEIMARLRDPNGGCPWDREQTFATITPYTIEEAYEVADAIERGALDDLRGELGDLLFQVVFHARIAEEAGAFDFGGVVAGISEKLERRHPHVFGERRELGVAEQSRLWEDIKRDERERRRANDDASAGSTEPRRAGDEATDPSGDPTASRVLADVPVGLPGLSRAAKLGKRAAAVGFDWPDVAGVRAKLSEEVGELDAALAGADRGAVAADLDAETCVRGANARFEKRFAHVEQRVRAEGGDWSAHDPPELDRFWREAKS